MFNVYVFYRNFENVKELDILETENVGDLKMNEIWIFRSAYWTLKVYGIFMLKCCTLGEWVACRRETSPLYGWILSYVRVVSMQPSLTGLTG